MEDRIHAEMKSRGRLKNASTFAFTATPKGKTLELFGRERDDGKFEAHHLYSMRQAIEEGFILDVLEHYTTYETYYRLLKTVEDDPEFERSTAQAQLKSFVHLHPHAVGTKVDIMVRHFHQHVAHRIGGRAKAMIVTRSRLHCVRYKLALDQALKEGGYRSKALVAFSGTVEDGGKEYTESKMNGGLPEGRTAAAFEQPENRFLVVANKFQTGFDQPLLHTMYVDKKLGGVNAVQTLSRLNRTHPQKEDTMVLDFANDAETIRQAFQRYYNTTILSEASDRNRLYDLQHELEEFGVFTSEDVDAVAEVLFDPAKDQGDVQKALSPTVRRAGEELDEDEMQELRSLLKRYSRQYAFLSQVIPFTDADLEKLYHFARHLRRALPPPARELPREIQAMIDMDSLRVERKSEGKQQLEPTTNGEVDSPSGAGRGGVPEEVLEPLSRIIEELNQRHATEFGPDDKVTLGRVVDRALENEHLRLSVQNNDPETARLAFDHATDALMHGILETNFRLYKRITEDSALARHLRSLLFDLFKERLENDGPGTEEVLEEIGAGETKTREFKSSLRWNLHTEKKDDRITHSALKTIAAFQNTEGGVLYLGVADDGEILGIEHDGFPDGDRFLLHLVNVTKSWLGKPAATRMDPRLFEIGDKTICRVECPKSPKPVFLKFQGDETFYVRSGPSTEALSPSEMHEYVGERFGG